MTQLVGHQRRISAFIGTLVHHPADIEDLYRQTCLVLWKKRDHFEAGREFFPWACGIAKHEVFNCGSGRSPMQAASPAHTGHT